MTRPSSSWRVKVVVVGVLLEQRNCPADAHVDDRRLRRVKFALELEEAETRAEVVVVAVAVEFWRRQRPGLVGVVRDGEGEEEQHEHRSPAFSVRVRSR